MIGQFLILQLLYGKIMPQSYVNNFLEAYHTGGPINPYLMFHMMGVDKELNVLIQLNILEMHIECSLMICVYSR